MAGQDRESRSYLEEQLTEAPYGFGFFQAIRLLECLHSDKPRFGKSKSVADDPVRLGFEPSLSFEHATISSYQPGTSDSPARLVSRFLGLLGPNGPLPLHLTEFIRDRKRHHDDPTAIGFFDIFHHRMLCLFYRAWANARPVVSYDRRETDQFAAYLGSLFGLGADSLRDRDCMEDSAKFHFSGLLSSHTRHAEGLRAIVSSYFKVPVEIDQFIGEWLKIPEHQKHRLGESPNTGNLGQSVILGHRVWSRQHKFRIILGPLDLKEYLAFLPLGRYLKHLVAVVRNYVGDDLFWDVNLVLKKSEVPPLRLDGNCALGWTAWLGKRASETDANDLMLNPFPSATQTLTVFTNE